MRLLARIFLLILCLWAGSLQAQPTPDYSSWETLAEQAEAAITQGDASDTILEDLRRQIATFRERFLTAQGLNSERIDTLQAQLDALGAPPESGPEAPEIAQRRADLTAQLTNLRAPVLAAEEAYTRANGLVGEIDNTVRQRQTEALLSRGPSAANPGYWPAAVDDLLSAVRAIWQETVTAWSSESRRSQLVNNLPSVLALLLVSFMLIWRGPVWAERGVIALRRMTHRGPGFWGFVLSLGQVILPLIGIAALTSALRQTGLVGERADDLLEQMPFYVGLLICVRWLANQTFSRDDHVATLPIPRARRTEARYYFTILPILLVLRRLMLIAMDSESPTVETLAVLEFPFIALCALMLFRVGQVLSDAQLVADASQEKTTSHDELQFRLRIVRGVGRAAMLVALVTPAAALLGFKMLAVTLLFPTIATIMLIGLVMVLQRVVADFYELVTGVSVADAQSLIPTLAGFVLLLATLPPLALIWGARMSDLTELWAQFREGFMIGETRISPIDFLTFAVVFAIFYGLTRLLQSALRSAVLPKTRIDIGGQNAILSGIGYVGVFLAGLVAITSAGIDLSSLAIVAGALSVGIGFGLQNIVSNFVSGIILLIERPISEGDWIEVGGQMGTVKDISVRSTRIETFDRTDVIVPNADLITGTVTNYTRGNTLGRVIVSVGVAYGTDTRKVERILTSIARVHPLVMMNPAPFIYFKGFGSDALEFEIRAILSDVLQILVVQNEMHHEIARRFAEEGIEIPFAQRDVWLRNPEALRRGETPVAGTDTAAPVEQTSATRRETARTAGMSEDAGDANDPFSDSADNPEIDR